MTISYVGKNNEFYGNKRPFALINYDKKEEKRAERVLIGLSCLGYEVEEEDECASIGVADREDYEDLVRHYLGFKKGANV